MSGHKEIIEKAIKGDKNALDSLIYATNRGDEQSRMLVDEGILKAVMPVLKKYPTKTHKCWDDDSNEADKPEYWLAFDILTNLCKWRSVHPDLLKEKTVEILAELLQKDNYFGFEATEGLSYIVGRLEDGANSNLLKANPKNVEKIIKVLNSTLNGNGSYYGMQFSVYGRVLALHCLSMSDANKPLLKDAMPLLMQVITEHPYDEPSVMEALQTLLQLSFDDRLWKEFETGGALANSRQAFTEISKDTENRSANVVKAVNALLFRWEEREKKKAPPTSNVAASEAWVMISYNWQSQPLIKALVPLLEGQGLKVWVDYNEMSGDTISAMAAAVEKCSVFLMCMSERYKESGNCRLEANYAQKLSKPIIPLMMQDGYVANGWLGILSGNKLYYPCYDESVMSSNVGKIVEEIRSNLGGGAAPPMKKPEKGAPMHGQNISPAKSSMTGGGNAGKIASVEKYTNQQVRDWVKTFLPKYESTIKKYPDINGITLAMIFDIHEKGGNSVDVVVKLGIYKIPDALLFLYQLKALMTSP